MNTILLHCAWFVVGWCIGHYLGELVKWVWSLYRQRQRKIPAERCILVVRCNKGWKAIFAKTGEYADADTPFEAVLKLWENINES